ncbi:MAG: hypothetical protein AMXMBFR84_18140 [Candidatus Hydrogenedentota bacterium]
MNLVLIVAEDKALRESLAAALPDASVALFEPNVEQAIRRMIAVNADVVILDDWRTQGRDALRQLRGVSPDTPVIVLSNYSDSETLASYLLAGASAALPKPFNCADLHAAMDRARPLERTVEIIAPPAPADITPAAHLSQHQTALRWLGRAAGMLQDPQRLLQTLQDAVSDIFDPVRTAILLEQGGEARVAVGVGLSPALTDSLRLGFAAGLMRCFEENPCLIDRNLLPAQAPAAKHMRLLGARFGVPLLRAGRVVGAILIGEKATGRAYSQEERDLLTSFARCASIALDNAQTYDAVAEKQTQLDTAIARLTSGVIFVRADNTISMMNASAEKFLQVSANDHIGRSVQRLGSELAHVVLQALRENRPVLRHTVRDRATNTILGVSVSVLEGDGAVVLMAPIPAMDERTAQDDLETSPFWEFLSARVAQEIKNPLVAINTFAQLLPKKYESQDFRDQFCETVMGEVARINRVVESLFDFARQPKMALQRVHINDTINTVLDSFREKLGAAGIRLNRQLDPSITPAEMDPVYVAQAIHNLVKNAIEAMPEGGVITVASGESNNRIEITVTDSGPGVPEQFVPLIFLPFFSTREKGMGLGLTLARRTAVMHGGTLEYIPGPQGCRFRLSVPLVSSAKSDAIPPTAAAKTAEPLVRGVHENHTGG